MTIPETGSPLRQRMIEDMVARKLVPGTQRGHIFACKQFAAYLGPFAGDGEARRCAQLPAASHRQRQERFAPDYRPVGLPCSGS